MSCDGFEEWLSFDSLAKFARDSATRICEVYAGVNAESPSRMCAHQQVLKVTQKPRAAAVVLPSRFPARYSPTLELPKNVCHPRNKKPLGFRPKPSGQSIHAMLFMILCLIRVIREGILAGDVRSGSGAARRYQSRVDICVDRVTNEAHCAIRVRGISASRMVTVDSSTRWI